MNLHGIEKKKAQREFLIKQKKKFSFKIPKKNFSLDAHHSAGY